MNKSEKKQQGEDKLPTNSKPVSLYPLSFDQVVEALVNTPKNEDKKSQRKKVSEKVED